MKQPLQKDLKPKENDQMAIPCDHLKTIDLNTWKSWR